MPQVNRRFTDFRRFPRSISVKSIVMVMSQVRETPPGILLLPPWWGRALPPTLIVGFILGFLEAMQVWQCFLESQVDALWASCWNPQNSNVSTNCHDTRWVLLLWQCGVWSSFASLSISRITSSVRPQFQHGFSEPCITNKIVHECSCIFVLCTSFGVDLQCGILYHLLSSRTCDRVVDPSWCKRSG